jgi:hypothetical protein
LGGAASQNLLIRAISKAIGSGVEPLHKNRQLIQRSLNAELNRVLRDPSVMSRLAEMGSRDVSGSSAQFQAFIKQELPLWESVVKRSGATVD